MRLEDLYTNFGKSSPDAQALYVTEYRLRRAEDMLKTPTWPKPKKVSANAIQLTKEEELLMSLMGLKRKEVIALRKLKEN